VKQLAKGPESDRALWRAAGVPRLVKQESTIDEEGKMGTALEQSDGFEKEDSGDDVSSDLQACEGTPARGHGQSNGIHQSPPPLIPVDRDETPIRRVEIGSITVPEDWRSVSNEIVKRLANSSRVVGLLHPIGVRPDPERPGRYILVHGRHRLLAVESLGEATIEAKVRDMDDETATMTMLTENLSRSPLKGTQYHEALAEWSRIYQARYPEVHGKRAGGEGKRRKRQAQAAGADSAPAEDTRDHELPPTFTEMAAEKLGISQRAVQKDLKVAQALTFNELKILEDRGVGKTDTQRIAAIADRDSRRLAVDLIAHGASVEEAIAAAKLPKNATLEVVAPEGPRPPTSEEMTDADWARFQCDALLDRVVNKDALINDAILYRLTRDIRQKIRTASIELLEQSKGKAVGPFFFLYRKFVNIDHPKSWLWCGPCQGTGKSSGGEKCNYCRGHGYSLTKGVWPKQRRR
jgi:hypothetical protein